MLMCHHADESPNQQATGLYSSAGAGAHRFPTKQVFQSLLLHGQLDYEQFLQTYSLIKIPGDLHKYHGCSKIQRQLLVSLSVCS